TLLSLHAALPIEAPRGGLRVAGRGREQYRDGLGHPTRVRRAGPRLAGSPPYRCPARVLGRGSAPCEPAVSSRLPVRPSRRGYGGRMTDEVAPDHDREWVEFFDPEDPQTLVRADLTWLLSRWGCIFGKAPEAGGCPGIDLERSADGCCLHGAFYTDGDDVKRVRRAVGKLTAETWQLHRRFKDT